MNELEKMRLIMAANDCAQRLVDAQERQSQLIDSLLDSLDNYRQFLEEQATLALKRSTKEISNG